MAVISQEKSFSQLRPKLRELAAAHLIDNDASVLCYEFEVSPSFIDGCLLGWLTLFTGERTSAFYRTYIIIGLLTN